MWDRTQGNYYNHGILGLVHPAYLQYFYLDIGRNSTQEPLCRLLNYFHVISHHLCGSRNLDFTILLDFVFTYAGLCLCDCVHVRDLILLCSSVEIANCVIGIGITFLSIFMPGCVFMSLSSHRITDMINFCQMCVCTCLCVCRSYKDSIYSSRTIEGCAILAEYFVPAQNIAFPTSVSDLSIQAELYE